MEKQWTIIAGSSCDLYSRDLSSDKIDFQTVPLEIMLDSGNFIDDENLDLDNFIGKMAENKSVGKTTCPSPERFAEIMRKGENIIVVTISSALSGTYSSACVAAETVKAKFPDKKIYVLDSRGATASEAKLLFELRDLIENTDLTFDEIVAKMIPLRDKTRTKFFLHNLQNLAKNGRMSKIVGMIASLIKLKLVCGSDEHGEIVKHGVALTTKKALSMMAAAPAKEAAIDPNLSVVISHCFNETDALLLKNEITEKLKLKNIKVLKMRGLASFYADYQGVVMGY